MSLPTAWVEFLFSRLSVRYGAAFLRQYDGLDPAMVKGDWARVLAGFTETGLRYALEHLPPDRPPNAMQFRAICNARPASDAPALPPPDVKADPVRVRQAIARITAPQRQPGATEASYCIRRLRGLESSGKALTLAQRAQLQACEQQASGTEHADGDGFRPIAAGALPPGMRSSLSGDAIDRGEL